MRPLLVLLLLSAAVFSASSLTEGEKTALNVFLDTWPALGSQSPPWSKSAELACTPPGFYGVECGSDGDMHVTNLFGEPYLTSSPFPRCCSKLNGLNLVGSIPSEISGLQWLEELSFEQTCLSSALGPELYQLPNLATLAISDSGSGYCDSFERNHTLINDTVAMKSMRKLSIAMTTLRGSIPEVVGFYSSLEHLHLSSVFTLDLEIGTPDFISSLSGQVPSSFSQLENLKSLRLENTNLQSFQSRQLNLSSKFELLSISGSGHLQVNLLVLLAIAPNLRYLDVSGSSTSFPLQSRGPFPNLQFFYARSTRNFLWHLPDWFWTWFPNIRRLAVVNGTLIGSISPRIGDLKLLEFLDLSGSSFEDIIPPAIGNCTSLETLRIKKTVISGPIPHTLCQLHASLRYLEISNIKSGGSTIPACLGELTLLKSLTLSSNGLAGQLPSNLGHLTQLYALHLDNNALEGPLPDVPSQSLEIVDVHNNQLTGSIPSFMAAHVKTMILSHNTFSGYIPPDLFVKNKGLQDFDISHNSFSGSLPRFSPDHVPPSINASRNAFDGEVPAEYCEATYLELAFNKLTSLSPLLDNHKGCPSIKTLSVGHNALYDSLNFTGLSRLQYLSLRRNRYSSKLPWLPTGLKYLDASHNSFNSDRIMQWRSSLDMDSLTHLDLSSNSLSMPQYLAVDFFGINLEYLSLADNYLALVRPFFPKQPRPALTVLDLANTHIDIFTPSSRLFPNLVILKIARNGFSGELDLTQLLSLTQLDISENRFKFDVSRFSSMPMLISLIANDNKLYGTLVLADMPNLQSANFSSNRLDQKPDFTTIGTNVLNAHLRVLDISNNPIPTITSLNSGTDHNGLHRSSSSAPSVTFPESVTCFALSIWGRSSQFAYNENLFGYDQCECSTGYFGAPSSRCIKCPSTSNASSCGRSISFFSSGSFMFAVDNTPSSSSSPHTHAPSSSPSSSSPSSPTASIIQNLAETLQDAFSSLMPGSSSSASLSSSTVSSSLNLSSLVLETESCLVTTAQTLSGISNCQGGFISAEYFNYSGFTIADALEAQCREGSEGRLCSRCICNTRAENGSCWFQSGPRCAKCRRVFPLSTSIPVLCVVVLVSILLLSTILAIILRRKRTQSRSRFSELHILSRIFHRILYFKTLGNLAILITFLQTLISFTDWDASMRLEFLNLINGKTDGLGLQCFFPILSDPLLYQIAELSVPFVIVAIVAASVVIGGILARLEFFSFKSCFNKDSAADDVDEPLTSKQNVPVEYPTSALLASLIITVVKFLYFGTALTAHQYLFSSRQPYTGAKYIQFNPWMKSADAWTLIVASIPAIIIFDLIIPASFIFICWRARNSFKQPSVRIYYGSIFKTYRDSCFWWEIVNTLKKLVIAFVLKALPPTDALQSALIVSILSGVLLIQLTISPWKRKLENIFDGASSLLLIGALLATRPGQLAHLTDVTWYLWVLSVLFVVASAGVLLWQTIMGKTEYEKDLADFEERNMLNGHIHTIIDGNMTDTWDSLDASLNS